MVSLRYLLRVLLSQQTITASLRQKPFSYGPPRHGVSILFRAVHARAPPHHPTPFADNSDDKKCGQARGRRVRDTSGIGGRTSDASHNNQVKTSMHALNICRGSTVVNWL